MRWAFGVTVVLLLTACPRRSIRRAALPEPPRTSEAIIAHLARLAPPFETLRARYQATYEGERRQTFQLRLAAQKDSLLWASAGLMGFEGARLLWRPDSVFLLSRLSRELYVGSTDSVRALLPGLSPTDLLYLLLGYWPPSFSRLTWEWEADQRRLSGSYAGYAAQLTLAEGTLWPLQWQLRSASGETYMLSYVWASPSEATLQQLRVVLAGGDQLTLQPKQLEFNPPDIAFPFTVPAEYVRKPLSGFGFRP